MATVVGMEVGTGAAEGSEPGARTGAATTPDVADPAADPGLDPALDPAVDLTLGTGEQVESGGPVEHPASPGVIDLRDDRSGPIVGRSPAAAEAYERRDATQQARFVAVLVIAVLNALDLVTTYLAISVGAHEANPVVSWAISSPLVAVAKVLICGTLIAGAAFTRRWRRRVSLPAVCAAWAVVGFYALVVLLNVVNVLSHR